MEMGNQQVCVKNNVPSSVKDRIFEEFSAIEADEIIHLFSQRGDTVKNIRKRFNVTHKRIKQIRRDLADWYEFNYPCGFKPIRGYREYLSNEYGIVMKKSTRKFLTMYINADGYGMYRLQVYNVSVTAHRCCMYAHRQISDLTIDHIYGDKLDNYIGHLEYVTRSENNKRAYKLGIKDSKGCNNQMSKLSEGDVYYIFKSSNTINFLKRKFGVGDTTIYDIKSGRSWKHLTHPSTTITGE